MKFELVPIHELCIINHTELLEAEDFIKEKIAPYNVSGLEIHLKWHNRQWWLTSGYCKYRRKLIVAAVKYGLEYPQIRRMPINTAQHPDYYKWIYDKEQADSADEFMVWIAGHEFWHYLCRSKQAKGNCETNANKFGFEWMREFKRIR